MSTIVPNPGHCGNRAGEVVCVKWGTPVGIGKIPIHQELESANTCGMLPHDHSQTYRLVGARADETREVIAEGLSRERVTELFLLYMDLKQFPSLAVEDEEPPSGRLPDRRSTDGQDGRFPAG